MLRSLYSVLGQNFVIPSMYDKAKIDYYEGVNPEGQEIEDILLVKVKSNGEAIMGLFGDKGMILTTAIFSLVD